MSAVSEQYAVALFALAKEKEQIDEIEESLSSFMDALGEEEHTFFMHPRMKKSDKKEIVRSMSLPELLRDFLFVAIDNNRFNELKNVLKRYRQLKADMHKVLHVNIYSKRPLNEKRLSTLKEEYENKYNRQVTLENHVDESIVGGLRFEFDGKVVDDTINHVLNQLKSRLTK